MSAYSYALSVYPEMYGVKDPAPIQTKAKVEFSELVRPDSYWPTPYSIEQAFQIYRWLIRTAKPHAEYGRYNPFDILIGRGVMGSTDFYNEPLRSLKQLREGFHRAILGRSNGANTNAWRKEEQIEFGKSRIIKFPHYRPFVGTPLLGGIRSEAQIKALLDAYFSASGKLLVQLNSMHADAIEIEGLVIRVSTCDPFDFVFELEYGFDGSTWRHTLATGCQFIDTFGAALLEFQRVSGQNIVSGRP